MVNDNGNTTVELHVFFAGHTASPNEVEEARVETHSKKSNNKK